jgi:hypothetical protein
LAAGFDANAAKYARPKPSRIEIFAVERLPRPLEPRCSARSSVMNRSSALAA